MFHLFESVSGIEGGDGNIAAIDNSEVFLKGIEFPNRVVTTTFLFAGRTRSDSSGAEARTWAVGGGCVVGEAEDGDVEGGGVVLS